MSTAIDSRIDGLVKRIEILEKKSDILWDCNVMINKSHLVMGASRAIIWHSKLEHPRHLSLQHVKLLDQLYVVVRNKVWIADPYAEAIRLYNHLYPDGKTRVVNMKGLSRMDKEKVAMAEKQNGTKTPNGLSTVKSEALALGDGVGQPFLVKLNNIYQQTIEDGYTAAHETTAAILASFIDFLDGDDQVFFAQLFFIIFNFAYHDVKNQDLTVQSQTLENSESANTFCSIAATGTTKSFLQKALSKTLKALGG